MLLQPVFLLDRTHFFGDYISMSNSEIVLHDLNICNSLDSHDAVLLTAKLDDELLYFEVPKSLEKYLIYESFDAFLLAVLPPALMMGKNIWVRGLVSEKLFHNITNYLIPVLHIQNPKFQPISIRVDGFYTNDYPTANAVGCAMSCGVDSFASFQLHFQDVLPGYKITHLLNLDVGAAENHIAYDLRLANIKEVARYHDLPLIKISSNIHKIFPLENFQIHNVRNCAAILALQKLIKRFYYSSGGPYEECGVFPTHDCDYADPILLPLISTETTEFISGGATLTRIEKTKLISCNPLIYKHLDVCWDESYLLNRTPGKPLNCSQCEKCLRTLLTLDVLGKLELCEQIFDLQVYREKRDSYIEYCLVNPTSFSGDIFKAAVESNFAPILRKLKLKSFLKTRSMFLKFSQRPNYYLRQLNPLTQLRKARS